MMTPSPEFNDEVRGDVDDREPEDHDGTAGSKKHDVVLRHVPLLCSLFRSFSAAI